MNIYQILAVIGASLVVLLLIVGLIIFFVKKNKRNQNISEFPNLLEALGGIDNISESNQKGSRISVLVKDKKIIDKEKIKAEGIETIVISNKKITMVVDNKKAVLIFNYLNNFDNKKELV